jgi:tripartite-type tricarboxylate transporter receptor subunit TctC
MNRTSLATPINLFKDSNVMTSLQRPSRHRLRRASRAVLTVSLALLPLSLAHADDASAVASFYKGKQISVLVGSSPGGGFDAYSRLLARHIGRFIPGEPNLVVQNMEGAGGVRAANFIYNVAPKDGTVIGIVQRAVFIEPLFGSKEARLDARKLSWIGSLNTEWSVAVAWHDSGLTSIDDALKREFPVAASGSTSDDYIYPSVLNNVLGTKFKLISGYKGTAEEVLALQRGEAAGMIGWAWSAVRARAGQLVDDGQLKVVVSLASEPRPGLEHIPTVYSYAKTEEDRQVLRFIFAPQIIGRPYFGPPDVSRDRVAALQAAFDSTVKDQAFLDDAAKQKLELDPASATTLQKRIDALYATPPDIIAKAKVAREYKAPVRELGSFSFTGQANAAAVQK